MSRKTMEVWDTLQKFKRLGGGLYLPGKITRANTLLRVLAFKGTVQQDVIFTVGGTGTVLFIHLFVIAKLKK